jgi:hypothetical protein
MLARAEGDECIVCRIEDGKHVGPPSRKLIIEHANNDITDWSWNNIHLCCYRHNKLLEKLSVRDKIALFEHYSDHREKQRERENEPTRKSVLADEVDYADASTEVQLNRIYHPKWLKYVKARIAQEGSVEKKRLILSAAKSSGCSKQTSINYLELETSDEGVLQEYVDEDGNRMVKFREGIR